LRHFLLGFGGSLSTTGARQETAADSQQPEKRRFHLINENNWRPFEAIPANTGKARLICRQSLRLFDRCPLFFGRLAHSGGSCTGLFFGRWFTAGHRWPKGHFTKKGDRCQSPFFFLNQVSCLRGG
jgi:hypothetical protein